ncbi:hypothetical protein N9B82_05285, partial [Saprospiraceae bacterium]|nr:hypothetical protein [Saprospiraceae bacterium]
PFLHAKWNGCTLTDLVFPSFLFVVGLSMSRSFRDLKTVQGGKLLRKILKRGILIFFIGVLLNWFPFYNTHISDLRVFGVLQRIALSFLGAGVAIVLLKNKLNLLISAVALMLIHWGIYYFFGGTDPYSLADNIGRYVDIALVGESHIYGGFGIAFDPEGLLGTLTGMAQVILGYLIGKHLYEYPEKQNKRIQQLMIFAIGLFIVAKLWDMTLPINKPLWTASYVLYTVAIVTALLLVLVEIIDKRGINGWTAFLKVFGKNPLFSYILSVLFSKLFSIVIAWESTNLYNWLFIEVFSSFLPAKLASLVFALCFTLLVWLCSLYLYRKNIIVKV